MMYRFRAVGAPAREVSLLDARGQQERLVMQPSQRVAWVFFLSDDEDRPGALEARPTTRTHTHTRRDACVSRRTHKVFLPHTSSLSITGHAVLPWVCVCLWSDGTGSSSSLKKKDPTKRERALGRHWFLGVGHWDKVDPRELERVRTMRRTMPGRV